MLTQLEFEYGEFQDGTSWYVHAGEGNAGELVYLALGLVGEAGEFADAIKKIVRETGSVDTESFNRVLTREGVKDKLIDELGDTFWYLNKLLMFLGISQEELMVRNTYKLYSRLMTRSHIDLTELKWPFTNPQYNFADVQEQYTLLQDKSHDGV